METPSGSGSSTAQGLTDRLRQDSRQTIENRKRSAAEQINEVATALGRAGEQLDQSQPTLAAYANQMATSVSNLATRLRDGSLEQLIDDTRQIARRNPGLFILGGFVAGVALARFMKASERSTYESNFSGDFTEASAGQEEYPGRAYSPSVGTGDQSFNTSGESTPEQSYSSSTASSSTAGQPYGSPTGRSTGDGG